ncbi:ABC transporter permease [Streptomyces sp. NP160]|uniref:FtsX-like permease family protein n=1 Tax=Streptomyces sp. NP160 TaxID=2586637 RepID=UPI0011186682|nr:ABC transporter permease [Streptomyces sp. NP160]TNM70211.1 ABC transporter permease [Streptomyces sp. NP160]
MLRLTLRQARSTAGRLLLAGVAVALGTGFVAAVLLTSALFTRTVAATVAAQYTGADVVVRTNGAPLSESQVADLRGVPGVGAAEGRVDAGVQLVGAAGTEYTALRSTSSAPELAGADRDQLLSGALPAAPGQVAVARSTAERLGVQVGGSLAVRTQPSTTADAGATEAGGAPDPVDVPVEVVGLLDDDAGGLFGAVSATLATPADALNWSADAHGDLSAGAPTTGYTTALVIDTAGSDPEQVRDAVAQRLEDAGLVAQTGDWDPSQGWTGDAPPADVLTVQQVVDRSVDDALGGTRILTGVVLAFAAVALVVATTVITNTFSVLVAQRTRQLALLRCVGATKGQVRRGVLAEAAVLGVVASVVGVLAGTALSVAAAQVLARHAAGVPVPDGVVLTTSAVLAPLAVGTLATVLAAWVPARAATRVSPLEALRPLNAPDLRLRASRVRLVSALLLLLGGGTLLVVGVLFATGSFNELLGLQGTGQEVTSWGVAAAVLGGTASFTGVLLGAVFLVPRTVSLVGLLVARAGGAPSRLAALNAVRNPRRTASTAGALLIGTTLVALMVVGAATTSRTLSAALDRQFPVDVTVSAVPDYTADGRALPSDLDPALVSAARAVPGVGATALLTTGEVTTHGGPGASPDGATFDLEVVSAPREDLEGVLVRPADVAPLAPGTAVLSRETAQRVGVRDGGELLLTAVSAVWADDGTVGADGSGSPGAAQPAPPELEVRVAVTDLGGRQVVLAPEDAAALQLTATQDGGLRDLWLRTDPGADPVEVAGAVQSAVGDATGPGAVSTAGDAYASAVSVSGLAAERAGYQRVIDTMLLVVVGLLAVAVVIALVGVANTLSLSVIERTRENAVLRALGLTRGQLRRMLALEGALVAGVGGLLGVVLGSLYGWAGAASLLGGVAAAGGDAVWTPSVPWARLGLLLAVAVVAGLLASVLPARRAVRTPPVAALADQ